MIRFGLIGAGRLGSCHAASIARLQALSGISGRLTAVYDPLESASAKMRERYGAAICGCADEVARRADVDAVVVASPTCFHQEGIRAAVSAGKPVFCEKPLCRSLETSREMVRLVRESRVFFAIGFVRRVMPKTLKLKALLDAGTIGRVRFCNVDLPFGGFSRSYGDWFTDFEKSGGVMIDMIIHHIDLGNWFFGEPARVYADGLLLDPSQEQPSDMMDGIVTYRNGVIFNIFCTWQRFGRSNERMEIYGEKGALTMSAADTLTFAPPGGEPVEIPVEDGVLDSPETRSARVGDGYQRELIDFARNVLGEPAPLPGIEDGLRSIEVCLGMIESARTGRAVHF